MTRADILAIADRYARAGYQHGGRLRCAPDAYEALVKQSNKFMPREMQRFDWEPLPTSMHYLTLLGNVAVIPDAALEASRCAFVPNAPPDESWRMHAGWLP